MNIVQTEAKKTTKIGRGGGGERGRREREEGGRPLNSRPSKSQDTQKGKTRGEQDF